MKNRRISVSIEFSPRANPEAHDADLLSLRDEIIAGLDLEQLLEPETGNGRDLVVYNSAEGGTADRGEHE